MDPNATLAVWRDATARWHRLGTDGGPGADALREAMEAADDLVTWLDRGGFAPEWKGSR